MKLPKCEIDGCEKQAPFALFITLPDGTKQWLNVCAKHEKEIGDENLRRFKMSSTTNPHQPTIIDETSGVEVSNERYKDFEAGVKAEQDRWQEKGLTLLRQYSSEPFAVIVALGAFWRELNK